MEATDRSASEMRWALPLAEHPQLEITSNLTHVVLVPLAPGEEPWVGVAPGAPGPGRHRHGLSASPKVTVTAADGVTRVQIEGAGAWFEGNARGRWWEGPPFDRRRRLFKHTHAQVVAHVPRDVKVRARASTGRVVVEHLDGCELTIEMAMGLLQLDEVGGRLNLSTQAGRLEGRGLRGSLHATTTAGTVSLEILALDPGKHEVRTNMGATFIELADGMPVQIDTRTAMGAARVDASSTRGAASILDVEADLGAIRVVASQSRRWKPTEERSPGVGPEPYRTPSERDEPQDLEVERVLARVADGSLSPSAARDLLRAMGFG